MSELQHYGVVGMKWGVRRYQNPDGTLTAVGKRRDARRYTKQLNELDKQSTKHIGEYMKADAAARVQAGKARRLVSKVGSNPTDKDLDKLDSIREKAVAANKKAEAAKKAFEDVDSTAWKVLAEAAEAGYTVHSKQVYRNAEEGRTIATQLLAGPIGQITITEARNNLYYKGQYQTLDERTGRIVDQAPWAVSGNKYKVTI